MPTHQDGDGESAIDPLMLAETGDGQSSMSYRSVREATEKHARPRPDGGSVEVRAVDSADAGETVGDLIGSLVGSMSGAQMAAVAAGGIVLLAALSGDVGADGRSGGSGVSCPECGETKSKRGMMGHLRWSHDLDADELDDAKAKAGIGQ